MSNSEAAEKVIGGYRLLKPSDECPLEIYELMLRCWESKPELRPSFEDIVTILINLTGPGNEDKVKEEKRSSTLVGSNYELTRSESSSAYGLTLPAENERYASMDNYSKGMSITGYRTEIV
jgi:hypothetical protein